MLIVSLSVTHSIQLDDKLSKKYNHIDRGNWSPQSKTILANEHVVRAQNLSHVVPLLISLSGLKICGNAIHWL